MQLHSVHKWRVELHTVGRLSDAQQAAVPPRLLIGHRCRIQYGVQLRGAIVQAHKQRGCLACCGGRGGGASCARGLGAWLGLCPLLLAVGLRGCTLLQPPQRLLKQLVLGPVGGDSRN